MPIIKSKSNKRKKSKFSLLKPKKKILGLCCATVLLLVLSANIKPKPSNVAGAKKEKGCATIQSGKLLTSEDTVIKPGYDKWGYNYQARMFNGDYCDSYRDAGWCQPYKGTDLIMKWNDAWLSNKSCDNDGLLDRYYGHDSYIGSGAWLTNHMKGEYDMEGKSCKWEYFVKIVAAPDDATKNAGVWYNADGTEIGPEIWGAFATIQQVENDPCADLHGLQYASPDRSGLGNW